MTYAVTFVKTE